MIQAKLNSLLDSTGKAFKTDSRYLIRGGFWLTLNGFLSTALSFLTILAFANLLTSNEYGTYQYILSLLSLISIFNLDGINTAITRASAQGYGQTLGLALKEKINWSLFSSLISLIIGIYYLNHDNLILGLSLIITSMLIPFWENFGIYVNYLQGKKEFQTLSIYDFISQLFNSTVVIITLFITTNPLIIVIAYTMSWLLIRWFLYFRTIKLFPPKGGVDHGAISYGKHLTLMIIPGTISSNIDRIILWQLLGPTQLAIYIFSLAIPMKINGFTKIINRLAFPKLATRDLNEIKKNILPKISILLIATTFLTVAYVMTAPLLFKIFFPQYVSAVYYTQLASLLILLQPSSLISSTLTAKAKKKELYIYNFSSPLIKIGLFAILIPQLGITGAVMSIVSATILDSFLLIFLLKTSK